jgi:hypothetical protein
MRSLFFATATLLGLSVGTAAAPSTDGAGNDGPKKHIPAQLKQTSEACKIINEMMEMPPQFALGDATPVVQDQVNDRLSKHLRDPDNYTRAELKAAVEAVLVECFTDPSK